MFTIFDENTCHLSLVIYMYQLFRKSNIGKGSDNLDSGLVASGRSGYHRYRPGSTFDLRHKYSILLIMGEAILILWCMVYITTKS